jgi:3-hydroxyisobutyrate dehydrogenase-like beta-hydroxyacid dehydrogenase
MNRKPRKTVGLLGLGIIGSRAAAGLRAAGFQTFVWNRTPQPAPNFLATPAEVAGAADILQIFVADAQALFDVLAALRERLTPQHLVIASGTFGPEATVEAAEFVRQAGARFLDAPFTGSKGAAEKRQLVYYVGGDDADVLRARPILEATSKAIVRIGRIGDAAIVKIVTNMIAAVSIQALAEALAIVRKAGLADEVLGAALEHNACRNGTMELKLPKMISGDYEPHFSLKHMFKDVQLGIQMANALDLDVPAASVTAGAMFGGIKHGWADLDFAALFKVYENLRGHHHALDAPPAGHANLGLDLPTSSAPSPPEPNETPKDELPAPATATTNSASAESAQAMPAASESAPPEAEKPDPGKKESPSTARSGKPSKAKTQPASSAETSDPAPSAAAKAEATVSEANTNLDPSLHASASDQNGASPNAEGKAEDRAGKPDPTAIPNPQSS